jgi:hypothetical protein
MSTQSRLGNPLGPEAAFAAPPLGAPAKAFSFVLMLLGAGGIQAFQGFGRGGLLLKLLGALAAAAVVVAVARRVLRPRIRVFERGFTVTRPGRSAQVALEEVHSLSFESWTHTPANAHGTTSQRLRFGTPAGSLAVGYQFGSGQPDPLGEHLGAIIGRLADAADPSRGGTVAGNGWKVERAAIHAAADRPVALSEVSAYSWIGGRLGVWKGDASLPFLEVPAGSPNAWVLEELLRRHARPREVGGTGLGRLLYEQGPSGDGVAVRSIVSLVLVGIAALIASNASNKLLGWGLLLAVLALAGFALAHALRQRARVFEGGFGVRGLFGERTMAFGDAESLTFEKLVRYTNNIYAGTTLRVAIRGASGTRLDYSTTLGGGGDAFDVVRDRAAAQVASRLSQRLAREGTVRWRAKGGGFPEVSLTNEGVVVGGRKPATVGYAQAAAAFNQGFFSISRAGESKPVASLASGAENFFPGYLLFRALGERAGADPRALG